MMSLFEWLQQLSRFAWHVKNVLTCAHSQLSINVHLWPLACDGSSEEAHLNLYTCEPSCRNLEVAALVHFCVTLNHYFSCNTGDNSYHATEGRVWPIFIHLLLLFSGKIIHFIHCLHFHKVKGCMFNFFKFI